MATAMRWISKNRLAGGGIDGCCVVFWDGPRVVIPCLHGPAQTPPNRKEPTRADAERMIRAAEGGLAPVYAPLAEEITERLSLADKDGVGIDLGSGPGTLIIELCKRTRLHWINADINPHFFPYFLAKAEAAGCGGRVSAIRADACALPFRDDFADVIVSRGSLQFWPDLRTGLAEIHRVLKPGGAPTSVDGLPERMPVETARNSAPARRGPEIRSERDRAAASQDHGVPGHRGVPDPSAPAEQSGGRQLRRLA